MAMAMLIDIRGFLCDEAKNAMCRQQRFALRGRFLF